MATETRQFRAKVISIASSALCIRRSLAVVARESVCRVDPVRQAGDLFLEAANR